MFCYGLSSTASVSKEWGQIVCLYLTFHRREKLWETEIFTCSILLQLCRIEMRNEESNVGRLFMIYFFMLLITYGVACSTEKNTVDGAALARQVCECTERTNAMKANEPNRESERKKCDELQKSTWATVKGTDQQDAYNAIFPCGL